MVNTAIKKVKILGAGVRYGFASSRWKKKGFQKKYFFDVHVKIYDYFPARMNRTNIPSKWSNKFEYEHHFWIINAHLM